LFDEVPLREVFAILTIPLHTKDKMSKILITSETDDKQGVEVCLENVRDEKNFLNLVSTYKRYCRVNSAGILT
jgi:hypothetical protein